jgi:hypothetical protein
VEHEMYDYPDSNWSYRNSNKGFKGKLRTRTRKTFNRFTTKDSYTSHIIEDSVKYRDLIIEIKCMWNVKTKVTPVVIYATGTISKSFRKYLSSIPGKRDIKELQKTAILSTAHILRKVLM